MRKFLDKKIFVVTSIILIIYVLTAIFSSALAPYDPLLINSADRLLSTTKDHLLGTDEFGRDTLSRLLTGLRPSIFISVSATLIAMIVGTFLGLVAGYAGKLIEQVVMRIADIILCFPPMLLAVTIVGFWGSGVRNLIITIAITYIPTFVRLSYSSTMKVKHQEYIEAQTSLGTGWQRIMFRGILPNIMSPIIVQMSLTFGSAILLESGLSFLGMGIVPPTASLGQMISAAQGYLENNLSMLIWPSAVLVLLALTINIFGDSLRDILDPRLHRQ